MWDKNIAELANMDISDLKMWLDNVEEYLDTKGRKIAAEIVKEIRTRVSFLLEVGLDYLTLNRQSVSLSGGESQRIRLATQIGSQLVNVLYILDKPSIGLHQRDNERLIASLKELRDLGNTVIVVEHDIPLLLAIFSGWNDRLTAGLNNLVYNLIAVISTVSQKRLCTQTVNQCTCFLAIRSGTFCNNNSERHTMRIHGQMYFGVEPPFVRLIAWLPPTAPAAWGCTLQWLTSIISHS